LKLQGKGEEIARKGIYKERPHNSHPCEFARNGFIKKIKKWNSQETVFCKERNLQGEEIARKGGGICKEYRLCKESGLC